MHPSNINIRTAKKREARHWLAIFYKRNRFTLSKYLRVKPYKVTTVWLTTPRKPFTQIRWSPKRKQGSTYMDGYLKIKRLRMTTAHHSSRGQGSSSPWLAYWCNQSSKKTSLQPPTLLRDYTEQFNVTGRGKNYNNTKGATYQATIRLLHNH